MQAMAAFLGNPRPYGVSSDYFSRNNQSPQGIVSAMGTPASGVLQPQVSGSQQFANRREQAISLPISDPYPTTVGIEHRNLIQIETFFAWSGGQSRPPVEGNLAIQYDFPIAALADSQKIVASFVGKVEALVGNSAAVVLINEETGESLESQCDVEVLSENGIGCGDEFRCEIVRTKGITSTRLSRVLPKSVPQEQIDQIRAAFKERWTF